MRGARVDGARTAGEPAASTGPCPSPGGLARVRALLAFALVGLALALGLGKVANFDIPLHLETGATILETGPPHANIFSAIHPDRSMIDDKWLFQVVVYLVHRAGGFEALSLLKGLLVLALALVLLRCAAVRPCAGALVALLTGAALVAAHPRYMMRPDLVSLLFLGIVLLLVRTDRGRPRRGVLAGLLVLQIIWANTHGYFILGPLVVLLAAAGRLVDERRGIETRGGGLRLVVTGALMFAACLVNPYGLRGALYPFATLLDLWRHADLYRSGITEFKPTLSPYPRLPYDLTLHRVLIGALVAGLVLRGRRWRAADLLPACFLVAISLTLRRNVAPFAVGAAVLAAPGLARVDGWVARRAPRWGAVLAGTAVVVVLAVAGARGVRGRLVYGEPSPRTFGLGLADGLYPRPEVDFMERELAGRQPWNPFDYGAYLAWRLFPGVRPYIDGNTSGYPASFLARYVEEAAGRVAPAEIRERGGIDYFMVRPFDGLARRLFEDPGYAPVFAGLHCVIFVPREAPFEECVKEFDISGMLAGGALPEVLEQWIRRPGVRLRSLLNLAHGLALAGFDGAARRLVARALEIDPANVGANHLEGWLAQRAGDSQGARQAYDRALAVDPRAADVLSDRGWLAMEMDEAERARADLGRSLELFDADAETWWRLSRVAGYQGDRAVEREALERCLEIQPDHVEALLALAAILRRGVVRGGAGEADRARELLRRALRVMPEGPEREAVEVELREQERGS